MSDREITTLTKICVFVMLLINTVLALTVILPVLAFFGLLPPVFQLLAAVPMAMAAYECWAYMRDISEVPVRIRKRIEAMYRRDKL